MPETTLPAIHNALKKTVSDGLETILEIEGLRWSPRGFITWYHSDTSEAVRMSVINESGERIIYTFSATTVLGVGIVDKK